MLALSHARQICQMLEEACKPLSVTTESFQGCGVNLEPLRGLVAVLLFVCGCGRRCSDCIPGCEGVTKGEVDEEAFLPEQAPSVDVELWRGTAWCGEFGNYLFPAGLVACLCGSTKEDMATLCMCRIGAPPTLQMVAWSPLASASSEHVRGGAPFLG